MTGLPGGLDPVRAGRFGLWLLSKRASAARSRRTPWPNHVWVGYGGRLGRLIAPWRVGEYPGASVMLSAITGVQVRTARRWLRGAMPSPQARGRLALYLEGHIAEAGALLAELRQSVAPGAHRLTNGLRSGPPMSGKSFTSAPQVDAPILSKQKPASSRRLAGSESIHTATGADD